MADESPPIRELPLHVIERLRGSGSSSTFEDTGNPRGIFRFELIDTETGEVVERQVHNTLMDEGRNEILAWIGGLALSSGSGPFEYLAVGTDGSVIDEGDTQLGEEQERNPLDPNTNNGEYEDDRQAVEITGTWLFGETEANVTIREAALFGLEDGHTDQFTEEDRMLNRTVVDPAIDKTSSQELQVTWTLSMG